MGKFLSRREFLKGLAATGASAAAVGLFHVPAFAEGTDKYTRVPIPTRRNPAIPPSPSR